MIKPPPRLPTVAQVIRSIVPQSVWERLGDRPILDATIFGDHNALCTSVGSGAPLRLLFAYADYDGKIVLELWALAGKGVKTVAKDRVHSNRLTELLLNWEQAYLR